MPSPLVLNDPTDILVFCIINRPPLKIPTRLPPLLPHTPLKLLCLNPQPSLAFPRQFGALVSPHPAHLLSTYLYFTLSPHLPHTHTLLDSLFSLLWFWSAQSKRALEP